MKQKNPFTLYIIAILFFLMPTLFAGIINFQGNSSYIHVLPGAQFIVNQPLASVNGSLIKDLGGTISGSNVTFTGGLLQDLGNSMLLNAVFRPTTNTLAFSGGSSMKAARGTVFQTLQIDGSTANPVRIEGQPIFAGGITMQDSNSTVTFAIQSSLTQNITMNGGAIWLDDTLSLQDNRTLLTTGTVNLNGHRFQFGGQNFVLTGTFRFNDAADIVMNGELDVSTALTFTGTNTIQGNGNILKLLPTGSIIIDNDSILYMTDVVLKGLGTGGGTIVFNNNNSTLVLSSSTISMAGSYSMSQGKVTVNGPETWVVKNNTWTFGGTSLLTVDGVTLWLEKAGAPTFGRVAFNNSATNLSLINTGTICGAPCQESIDALQTSTGFLQSQIDICCSSLKTSTGFLQSQIDICCSSLKTSTGFLQSQIDICCSSLKTSTGFLQSQIDVCCSSLKTSTGFLQSQIDACCSKLDVCCNQLKTSTGFLQSQIDTCCSSLKTSTGFLQSQIDFCCSKLDNCCNQLKTSTGFLQSQLDVCCSSLKTSTGFLQSQIDVCCSKLDVCCNQLKTSTGFLQSQLDVCCSKLDNCCDQLKTSTGFLQSQIDTCCSSLKTSTGFLQSQIDFCCSKLDNCCNQLKTSTGYLQSQIDFCCSKLDNCCDRLKTSTGFLQSQIDICCSKLMTSTGFLQSQIDFCCSSLICCAVDFYTSVTQKNDVDSSAWSFDGNFIALGMNNNVGGDTNTLKIYKFNGSSLVLADSFIFSSYDKVTSVRWHPSKSLLAVTQNATGANTGLSIFSVNSTTGALTLVSSAEVANDIEGVSWNSDGSSIAITRNIGVISGELLIYDVSGAGVLSGPTITTATGNIVEHQAVDWHKSNYIAVGEVQSVSNEALEIYNYDPIAPALFVNASTQVPATPGNSATRASVTAVRWHPTNSTIIAVGLQTVTGSDPQSLQIWQHDPGDGTAGAGTLTYRSGVSDSVGATVNSVDWSGDGNCLADGKTPTTGGSFQTYSFNKNTFSLIKRSEFGTPFTGSILDVNYNPVLNFVVDASASSAGNLPKATVYSNCANFRESLIDNLQSQLDFCCNQLKTSTGFLQSQIDFCCSKLDVCCNQLKTSTGFLQSQIDHCCSTTFIPVIPPTIQSQIDILFTCCDQLKTSTGFLQSQIDHCCSTTFIPVIPPTIQSQIDILFTCCDQLKTSTGYLQSQLDNCCSSLKTSTGFLQSQLDACCSSLKTSTGFLQSQIDFIFSKLTCCAVDFFTSVTQVNDIRSVSWSSNGQFIALGMNNNFGGDVNTLKIYKFDGSFLTMTDEHTFSSYDPVTSVRFNPVNNLLAVSQKSTGANSGISIFSLNTTTGKLTLTSQTAVAQDIEAISWFTDGTILVAGRNIGVISGQLNVYNVSGGGIISGVVASSAAGNLIEEQSLDWQRNNYIAVGEVQAASNNALEIFKYDPAGPILFVNASTQVPGTPGEPTTKADVSAVAWNHEILRPLLAVGLENVTGSAPQAVQIWQHDPGDGSPGGGTLTYKSGVPAHLNGTVNSLDWTRDSLCLAVGKTATFGGPLQTFSFNRNTFALTKRSEFGSPFSAPVLDVQWDPTDNFLLDGTSSAFGSAPTASLYSTCANFSQSSIDNLQSQIDTCCSSLDNCCNQLKTSTGFLQSQIDICCSSLKTSTGFLQSQLDFCCSKLDKCCDQLKTSTGFLQSQIDACCSKLDVCCNQLKTSTGYLQSQIDHCCSTTLIPVIPPSIQSQIDILFSCCDQLKTSTGYLQSQLDVCCSKIDVCCTSTATINCEILVTGTLYLVPAMLPAADQAVIFKFNPCFGRMCGPDPQTPRVIIDPVVFGSNRIPLNANTRMIFEGEGFVEVHDGIVFDYKGSPFTDMADWPALILQYNAMMIFQPGATVTFGGMAGKYILRDSGQMLLDVPSHVIFGENLFTTEILQIVDQVGLVRLANPAALLSYGSGTFDIIYSNHSTLDIINGTVEYNMLAGSSNPGVIRTWHMFDGSSLRIAKTGNPSVDGLLRMAPNFLNAPTDFDDRAGVIFTNSTVFGAGNIQYNCFAAAGDPCTKPVQTTLWIQYNQFAVVSPLLNIFMELTYAVPRGVAETPDATILARLGTIPDVDQDGVLAAFCPLRDGSVIALQQGDHDVRYDRTTAGGPLDVIRGYNYNNRIFKIFNCDPATRVDGAR